MKMMCVSVLGLAYSATECVQTGPSVRNRSHQARQRRCERTSEKGRFSAFRLAGYVTGSSGVNNMNPVERHAELVYAESLFEKALLGIVYSGDWLAFIKEACVFITPSLYHSFLTTWLPS